MIAFTFPGQGSQRPSMGEAWQHHPSFELVTEASDLSGRDVAHLLLNADGDTLRETRNSQLATFIASLVVLDAVERLGAGPTRVAGHSLGEYTALVSVGTLSFEDGVHLVTERADAMQVAAEEAEGTMAAVLGADDNQVAMACEETDGEVWVANYNGPGQVVIAGRPEAIEAASHRAKARGAKRVMLLPVGGAFHTPLMNGARDRLAKAIDATEFRAPDVPVFANVDATAHLDPADWPELLKRQLVTPVRWRQTLYELADEGVSVFVELGPGSVLTGLARRTAPGRTALSVSHPDQLDSLLETLHAPNTQGRSDQGEHLFITERLIVSPAAGLFTPVAELQSGWQVHAGQTVGHIGATPVRSPFRGSIRGVVGVTGERLVANQPVAWLTTDDAR